MNDKLAAEVIRELMEAYDKARAEWIDRLGTDFDEGEFHAWFTAQVRRA